MTEPNAFTSDRINERRLVLSLGKIHRGPGITASDLRAFVAELDRLDVADAARISYLSRTESLLGIPIESWLTIVVPAS